MAEPDAAAIVVLGLIAKLPGAMLALTIVLAVAQVRSRAVGGQVVAGLAAGLAVTSPLRGRWVDLAGPRRALSVLGVTQAVLLVSMFLLLPRIDGLPVLALVAFGIGATSPPLAPVLRSVWQRRLTDGRLRHAAQAWESISVDLAYITAPSLVAVITSLTAPRVSLVAVAALGSVTAWLLARRSERAWPTSAPAGGRTKQPFGPAMKRVVWASGCTPAGIVAAELGSVAIAERSGHAASAGFLVAALSVGSVVGGFVYGHRRPRGPARAHLVIAALVWGAGCVGAATVTGSLFAAGCLLAVAGLGLAVTFTAQFEAVGRFAPPRRETEGFAWMSTAGQVGTAVAAATVGGLGARSIMAIAAAWFALGAVSAPPSTSSAD